MSGLGIKALGGLVHDKMLNGLPKIARVSDYVDFTMSRQTGGKAGACRCALLWTDVFYDVDLDRPAQGGGSRGKGAVARRNDPRAAGHCIEFKKIALTLAHVGAVKKCLCWDEGRVGGLEPADRLGRVGIKDRFDPLGQNPFHMQHIVVVRDVLVRPGAVHCPWKAGDIAPPQVIGRAARDLIGNVLQERCECGCKGKAAPDPGTIGSDSAWVLSIQDSKAEGHVDHDVRARGQGLAQAHDTVCLHGIEPDRGCAGTFEFLPADEVVCDQIRCKEIQRIIKDPANVGGSVPVHSKGKVMTCCQSHGIDDADDACAQPIVAKGENSPCLDVLTHTCCPRLSFSLILAGIGIFGKEGDQTGSQVEAQSTRLPLTSC